MTHPEPGPTPEQRARDLLCILPGGEPSDDDAVLIRGFAAEIRAAEQAAYERGFNDGASDDVKELSARLGKQAVKAALDIKSARRKALEEVWEKYLSTDDMNLFGNWLCARAEEDRA